MTIALRLLFSIALVAAMATSQVCVTGTNAHLDYDGNDQVTIPGAMGALDGFGDFTIECWFRTTSAQGILVAKWRQLTPGHTSYAFYVLNGRLTLQFLNGGVSAQSAQLVNDGAWHHAAATRSGSNCTLFLDGNSVAVSTYSPTLSITPSPLVFGTLLDSVDQPIPAFYFTGSIDEVRIWSIARTQSQIQLGKNSGLVGNEPGLAGYWRCDENGGQLVADSSPFGNNGNRGASSAISAVDDPTWSTTTVAPLTYCAGSGIPQDNSILASLQINGAGSTMSPPYVVSIPSGNSMSLSWSGPPNAGMFLLLGFININPAIIGVGGINLGTGPLFQDVTILVDPIFSPWAPFFYTDSVGSALQSFTLSPAAFPPGMGLNFGLQGAILQPPGAMDPLNPGSPSVVYMTAAFSIVIP